MPEDTTHSTPIGSATSNFSVVVFTPGCYTKLFDSKIVVIGSHIYCIHKQKGSQSEIVLHTSFQMSCLYFTGYNEESEDNGDYLMAAYHRRGSKRQTSK